MYTIKGFTLKTSLKEMTIAEFEKISLILNNKELLNVEKYLDVFEELGMPTSVLNELTDDELIEIIQEFNKYEYDPELRKSFEHDGYIYEAYTEEFKLKAMDIAKIESSIRDNKPLFSTIIAILFKRTDLSHTEHYTSAHIKYKKDIIKDFIAADYYPYLIEVTKRINSKLQSIHANY